MSKYQEALDAGYSEEEILDHLSKKDSAFQGKYLQARQEGWGNEDIIEYLSKPKEKKDSEFERNFRTAAQIPQGIAEAHPYGLTTGLWHLLAQGELNDPEELEHLRVIHERLGIPFDEEKYLEAGQKALGTIPTVGNIASAIEERTGIPLEAKTPLQKGLRLGSSAYKFQGGPASQRAAAGVTAPLGSKVLQEFGVPEPLADLGGLGIGNIVGGKTPAINLTKTKPSGIPERGFERLTEPTEVPAKKIQQINDKLETDFKSISDEIIKDSPIGETAENLKNDPRFKRESKELLDQAQILANETPGTIPSMNYKQALLKQSQNQMKGFSLNEYKKNYLKFMKEAVENVIPENVTHGELVEQYRENNRSLGEYFEPGSSKALNRAKKDVLLDQNRAIATTLEESNPELSKVFKEGNERWTKIMDAETVDNFVSDMFPEGKKVDFKHMKGIFDDPNYQRIFKRALGEEGAKSFELAVEDMLTAERPYKMMREAQEKGMGDMLLTAKAYLFNPKLGYAKAGFDALRFGYRSLFNATLDKPRVGLNFTKAVKELKEGNFKAAAKDFEAVQSEILPKEQEAISGPTATQAKANKAGQVIQGEMTPQAAGVDAFNKYGLTSFIEEAAENGHINKLEDIEKYVDASPMLKMKAEAIEREIGKPFGEIIKDIYGEEIPTTPKHTPEKIEPETKAIEHKEPEKTSNKIFKEKVDEVKRQDISKQGLKTQKAYLLENIEKAIANPPKGDKVIFDVPGDGKFKINNNEAALKKFAENIEKRWPDKPYRPGRNKAPPNLPREAYKDYELVRQEELRKQSNKRKHQSPNKQ